MSTTDDKIREFSQKLAEIFSHLKRKAEAIDAWKALLPMTTETNQLVHIWKKIISLQEQEQQDFINKEIEQRLAKAKAPAKKTAVAPQKGVQPVVPSNQPVDPAEELLRKEMEQKILDELAVKGSEVGRPVAMVTKRNNKIFCVKNAFERYPTLVFPPILIFCVLVGKFV